MPDIISFDNVDDMFEHLANQNRLAREFADAVNAVEIINNNKYWLMIAADIVIVGETVSYLMPREQYESQEEYDYEKESGEEDLKNGYIFGRWYSEACIEGELGSNHISNCVPISEEGFVKILDEIQNPI